MNRKEGRSPAEHHPCLNVGFPQSAQEWSPVEAKVTVTAEMETNPEAKKNGNSNWRKLSGEEAMAPRLLQWDVEISWVTGYLLFFLLIINGIICYRVVHVKAIAIFIQLGRKKNRINSI